MTDTALGHQIAIATILVWLIELLKRSKWFPWLDQNTAVANRVVSVVAGLITAAGITVSLQGGLTDGGGVLIQWPAAAAIANGASHFVVQLLSQEVIYQRVVKQ